ncbi:class I SAM-dependent methyltransferase [Aquiflexum sp. TKW24L]|uniref:class I SAM-dependent methyltransferase n=1 Tax=Aquiflexum sp. TKW24L TaxID=2942212 RepID=UPI0020BD7CDB|nr:class I SAM-dependent methyltransferase [Aquiflexum sp. TKW24L]MCL6261226.1 class I SAM-dependent methyltransferase [Aquiflexum sp. TKW24L]
MKRNIIKIILFLGTPFTLLSSMWLRFVKKAGTGKIGNRIFMRLGIFPILDHYYEPMINPKKYLTKSLREDRELPGIDYNVKEQLELLANFKYNEELLKFPISNKIDTEFCYDNNYYSSGDAEYLYNIVRHFKPQRIIEIGSGNSTLMVRNAIEANKIDHTDYQSKHICIEPYEQPWLEKLDIELIREKVENIDKSFFEILEQNDILFIDSSHIIRPQGDVLFEYLELLPTLKSGVLIHVHDIFTPKDYLNEWVLENHFLWNEQYLLEAFLTYNSEFKIIGALNYLTHNYRNEFAAKCPIFATQQGREPGAFWMMKK